MLDWKRRVTALYADLRSSANPRNACLEWRRARDELFASHPQSPLPPDKRESFSGLGYFGFDPGLRVLASVERADPQRYEIAASNGKAYAFERIGLARFELVGREHTLELYWLDAYGGGLFVPFADSTSGHSTYGAGRYLLDTVKGADLGEEEGRLVFDFNLAYNPSCAYDPRWSCPLAPPPNRLDVEIDRG